MLGQLTPEQITDAAARIYTEAGGGSVGAAAVAQAAADYGLTAIDLATALSTAYGGAAWTPETQAAVNYITTHSVLAPLPAPAPPPPAPTPEQQLVSNAIALYNSGGVLAVVAAMFTNRITPGQLDAAFVAAGQAVDRSVALAIISTYNAILAQESAIGSAPNVASYTADYAGRRFLVTLQTGETLTLPMDGTAAPPPLEPTFSTSAGVMSARQVVDAAIAISGGWSSTGAVAVARRAGAIGLTHQNLVDAFRTAYLGRYWTRDIQSVLSYLGEHPEAFRPLAPPPPPPPPPPVAPPSINLVTSAVVLYRRAGGGDAGFIAVAQGAARINLGFPELIANLRNGPPEIWASIVDEARQFPGTSLAQEILAAAGRLAPTGAPVPRIASPPPPPTPVPLTDAQIVHVASKVFSDAGGGLVGWNALMAAAAGVGLSAAGLRNAFLRAGSGAVFDATYEATHRAPPPPSPSPSPSPPPPQPTSASIVELASRIYTAAGGGAQGLRAVQDYAHQHRYSWEQVVTAFRTVGGEAWVKFQAALREATNGTTAGMGGLAIAGVAVAGILALSGALGGRRRATRPRRARGAGKR